MFELLFGAAAAAFVLIAAAAIILTMPARRRPTVEQPWQKVEDCLANERAALLEAGRRIGAERGLDFETWGKALEDRATRFAHLVVAGTTTRANAIHRLTSWIRDRTQPGHEVDRLLSRIAESERQFVARMRGETVEAQTVAITEGYATAATIAATGRPVAMAGDAGNLQHAGTAVRAKFGARVQLISDADRGDS